MKNVCSRFVSDYTDSLSKDVKRHGERGSLQEFKSRTRGTRWPPGIREIPDCLLSGSLALLAAHQAELIGYNRCCDDQKALGD
jgi:hypothetical protein